MSKELIKLLESDKAFSLINSLSKECLSASDLLRKLQFSTSGRNIRAVKDYLIFNRIDFSHWTKNGVRSAPIINKICPVCKDTFYGKDYDIKNQITCSVGCANTYFRSYKDNPNYTDGSSSYRKLALSKLEAKCVSCGFENLGALEVHHIDKDRSNNKLSNLEVLCANCHKLKHKHLI